MKRTSVTYFRLFIGVLHNSIHNDRLGAIGACNDNDSCRTVEYVESFGQIWESNDSNEVFFVKNTLLKTNIATQQSLKIPRQSEWESSHSIQENERLEPENDPVAKESQLLKLHFCVQNINFQGRLF